MKNLKSLLLIAIFTLSVSNIVNAQKVAHIDYQRVIDNMPETRAAEVKLEKIGKTHQADIVAMAKKLDAKIKKYQAEQATQTKETNEKRALEVKQENQQYEQARRYAYEDIEKRRAIDIQPIIKKAQKAVEEVAAAKGILYVFDAKSLIIKKGEDLYDAVKAKLGLLKDKPKPQAQQAN